MTLWKELDGHLVQVDIEGRNIHVMANISLNSSEEFLSRLKYWICKCSF